MCEILVCCTDRPNSQVLAGDVIFVGPDDHPWGEFETGGRRADPDSNVLDAAAGLTQGELVVTVPQVMAQTAADPVVLSSAIRGAIAGANNIPKVQLNPVRQLTAQGAQEFATVAVADTVNGNHPFFRIFFLPNIKPEDLSSMLTPRLSSVPTVNKMTQVIAAYRLNFFDISKVTDAAVLAFWQDDARADGSYTWDIAIDEWDKYVTAHPVT